MNLNRPWQHASHCAGIGHTVLILTRDFGTQDTNLKTWHGKHSERGAKPYLQGLELVHKVLSPSLYVRLCHVGFTQKARLLPVHGVCIAWV